MHRVFYFNCSKFQVQKLTPSLRNRTRADVNYVEWHEFMGRHIPAFQFVILLFSSTLSGEYLQGVQRNNAQKKSIFQYIM